MIWIHWIVVSELAYYGNNFNYFYYSVQGGEGRLLFTGPLGTLKPKLPLKCTRWISCDHWSR